MTEASSSCISTEAALVALSASNLNHPSRKMGFSRSARQGSSGWSSRCAMTDGASAHFAVAPILTDGAVGPSSGGGTSGTSSGGSAVLADGGFTLS